MFVQDIGSPSVNNLTNLLSMREDVEWQTEGCECNLKGCEDEKDWCNPDSGQCDCKCNVQGLKCDECVDGYYEFPTCHGE